MTAAKEARDILYAAERAGWTVRRDGAGHYKVCPPGSTAGVSISASPSDYRAKRNNYAALRRMGLDLRGTRKPGEVPCLHSWHSESAPPGRQCPVCKGQWRSEKAETLVDEFVREVVPQKKPKPEPKETPVVTVTEPMKTEPMPTEPTTSLNGKEATVPQTDTQSRTKRVLAVLEAMPGDYLGVPEIATLADMETVPAGAALRTLYAAGRIARSKRGRYGALAEGKASARATAPEPKPAPKAAAPKPTPAAAPAPAKSRRTRRIGTQEDREAVSRRASEYDIVEYDIVDLSTPTTSLAPPAVAPVGSERYVAPSPAKVDPSGAPLFEYVTTNSKGYLVLKDEAGDLFVAVPLIAQF